MTKTRFSHRFVTVTETAHVVKKTSFSYRSFADRRDAMSAADAVNAKGGHFRRAYVVDTQNRPDVVLPR